MVGFKKSYAVMQVCTSGGWGGGGAGTPISKHTAGMVNGGVSNKTHIMHGGLQKRLRGCCSSLHKAQNSGGVGGRSEPHLQTQCSHGWFQNKLTCCQACLHKRGVGAAQPRPVCKHTARMVNDGVSTRLILCKAGFKKTTQRLSSKLAHGLKQRGRWGGGFANTMLAWLVSKKQRLSIKLAHGLKQRGVLAGGAAAPPPIENTMLAWLFSKKSY